MRPKTLFRYGLLLALFYSAHGVQARDTLILFGVDGLRFDYIDMAPTPNIDRVIERGFRVRKLLPAYPSFTFPNMYSLATGQYPSTHGVTGSKTFDVETGAYYDRRNDSDHLDPNWFQSTPIWTAAREMGVKTAVYHWVGSMVESRSPDMLTPFALENLETYYEMRLEKLRTWLALKEPPELILSYLFPIDKAGHEYGPNSPEVLESVRLLDQFVGDLMSLLQELNVNANLVFVSDHGMIRLKSGGTLVSDVHKALDGEAVLKVINQYTRMQIFLEDSSPENLARVISKLPRFSHLRWFTHSNSPYRLHPTRDGHIIGEMEPPFEFMKSNQPNPGGYQGVHGYGPQVPEMAASCFGMGPGFRPGSELETVGVVDVFPLMLHLLQLPQRRVDGSLSPWLPVIFPGKNDH